MTALGRPPHRAHGGHAHGSGGRFWDLANSARCVNGLDWITHPPDGKFIPRIFRIMGTCTVTARTVQGMARVRPDRLLPDPYLLVRSVRRGSRVKRDFACTFTWLLSPVLVVLRSQSRLRLEGRTRTLSGAIPGSEPSVGSCTSIVSDLGRGTQLSGTEVWAGATARKAEKTPSAGNPQGFTKPDQLGRLLLELSDQCSCRSSPWPCLMSNRFG